MDVLPPTPSFQVERGNSTSDQIDIDEGKHLRHILENNNRNIA